MFCPNHDWICLNETQINGIFRYTYLPLLCMQICGFAFNSKDTLYVLSMKMNEIIFIIILHRHPIEIMA